MTLDEIEERVKHSLEALNNQEELYDWRLTFYNTPAWANLQEGCYFLSQGQIEEATFKVLIKTFRDRSLISYLDFHIKVPEPGVDEFRRMAFLFGPLNRDVRLVPPRDAEARKAYVQEKVLSAMRLSMENKHVISEKIRQQFNWMMIREKVKTPEMLAVHLSLESYNPYHKKLAPCPVVSITQHREIMETEQEQVPAPAPMFKVEAVDNSSFEARLAPAPVKTPRNKARERAITNYPGVEKTALVNGVEQQVVIYPHNEETAALCHELPSEIHEEFAAYCQKLYEKTKGN